MFTILVIDDEVVLAQEVTEWLSFEGYEAICATSGDEGIEAAFKYQPDLILCDILMPRTDGHGVFHTLAASPITEKIPIIIMSAKATHDDLPNGTYAYIAKPFMLSEFLSLVKECLGQI